MAKTGSKQSKVLGITGGIGSGKSYALKILKEHGAYTIQADEVGHRLMEPGGRLYRLLVSLYGMDYVDEKGRLDRTKIREDILPDEEKREELNALTHPVIREEIIREIHEAREKAVPFIVLEAALLREGNLSGLCDEVWFIHAKYEDRLRWLTEERGMKEEEVDAIIEAQDRETEYDEAADRRIENPGRGEGFRENLEKALRSFLSSESVL